MKKSVKHSSGRADKKSSLSIKPRGVSKVLIISVIAVVLLGVGGFVLMQKQGTGDLRSALPFVKPALNPDCKHNDPDLCKFLNNWQVQENYTVTTKSAVAGMSMETIFKLSGQNKYQMLAKQNGSETSNIISIGDTTYTYNYEDNSWWKYTVASQDPNAESTGDIQEQFDFKVEEAADTTTYKKITKEACEDLSCFKYEVQSPDATGMKHYVWFDEKDYLLRKMVIEGGESGINESVFSYDAVSISEPSPVKVGTPEGPGSIINTQRLMEEQASFDSPEFIDYGAAPADL